MEDTIRLEDAYSFHPHPHTQDWIWIWDKYTFVHQQGCTIWRIVYFVLSFNHVLKIFANICAWADLYPEEAC